MEILYEDGHLFLANKPANLVTQVSKDHDSSFTEELKKRCKVAWNKPGNVFLEPVHRLDTVASGIVLFAKTQKALKRLQEALRQKSWEKEYLALLEAPLPCESAYLEHYLVHAHKKAKVYKEEKPGAKWARLRYQKVGERSLGTLYQIHLETGRYHQIRAQCAYEKSPICGDRKYGASNSFLAPGIALHHLSLKFPHPISGEQVHVCTEAPKWSLH